MSARHGFAIGGAIGLLLIHRLFAASPLQKVLVLCTADACEYHRIASFLVDDRASLRVVAAGAEKVGPAELKTSRELNVDQMPGLYRDPRSGTVYALGTDGKPRELALPAKVSAKDVVPPASFWQAAVIEYSDVSTPKTRARVAGETLAYLLVSPDAEQAAFLFLQRLLEPSETDPRRLALIRGALKFMAKSPNVERWRTSLVARMRDDLKRFEEQDGDPATLAEALNDAVQIRAIYVQVSDDKADKELLDRILTASQLLEGRIRVADVLRKAGYWDEYLVKVRQLGLTKWSVPNMLQSSREALNQSSQLHLQRSRAFTEDGHLDRAFDEADLAARNSCESPVVDEFYRTRVLLVDRNQIASAMEYTGRNKALLEQLVRELDQLDPTKEQLTLERIRRGEQLDPSYLPLQLKKAEFLDKLGRYKEALDVVQRIERNVRLDKQQLDEYLRLDGRITNNLTDAVQKAQEEARKQFELQKYQLALDAATRGLRADPANAGLLYVGALSASFLRQSAAAIRLVRTYLNEASMVCAPAGEPEKMLELFRILSANVKVSDQPAGLPSWISGMRYNPSEVFYDPISLAFLQPIFRIGTNDGLSTVFVREDRSVLVKSISTASGFREAFGGPATTPLFEAEPKYDRKALSMLEVGARANSAGDRTSYPLTYLNSPGLDPDLVFRFTGRQVARGWAGNPFFHPFIWSGFYIFDLTYDLLGRVATATPIREEAGARTDPFSEPLQFIWEGNSKRLRTIKGTRSGYAREIDYDKDGRIKSEAISFPKGHGSIAYEYLSDGPYLKAAKIEDNFYDRRERTVLFDSSLAIR